MANSEVTWNLVFAVGAAVLGTLQFGYNTGVINAPRSIIEAFILRNYDIPQETATFLFSVAVALFAVGGMIGSFTAGWVAEKRGPKNALIINSFIGVIGGVLMGACNAADSYEMLAIGRFIIGLNCGLATVLVPMYVSEIAPVNLRGSFGTIQQLAVTIGIVISNILGINEVLGTENGWPYLLGLSVVPSLLQIALLPPNPESPRFLLITKRDEEKARLSLVKLRNIPDVEYDVEEMKAEDRSQRSEESVSLLKILRTSSLRTPLIIGVVLHLSQQFSGINAVFYYSTSLFVTAGIDPDIAPKATIGIGGTMVVMTLISIPLMDRAGRRSLHLIGLGGMFIFSILMTVALFTSDTNSVMSIFSMVFTFGYVAFFGIGPGSIPWMIMAELFSQGPRPAAMAFGSLINWLANFVVGLVFPIMQTALLNYSFVPFTVLILLFWVFTYFKLPETKNRTIEEITLIFKK